VVLPGFPKEKPLLFSKLLSLPWSLRSFSERSAQLVTHDCKYILKKYLYESFQKLIWSSYEVTVFRACLLISETNEDFKHHQFSSPCKLV
jgi:hypothetical protein